MPRALIVAARWTSAPSTPVRCRGASRRGRYAGRQRDTVTPGPYIIFVAAAGSKNAYG